MKKIDYGKDYFVSEDGKVFSKKRGKIIELKPLTKGHDGYEKVRLYDGGKRKDFFVHRLVAEAFIENPNNLPIINHIDENKSNNNVRNLEWCTKKYNVNYGQARRKMSESMKAHFEKNPSEYDRVRKQLLGRSLSKESRKKIASKLSVPVECLQNGVVLRKYNSTKEAAESIGAEASNICAVLKGRRKRAAGYEWRYAACGGGIAAEMEEKRN